MSRLTQKLKVPQTLLDAYSGQAEIQQFFQGIENRDLIGEINATHDHRITADSVAVTTGTVTSGTVVDTRTINHTYHVVNESGEFKIDFTFVGLTSDPVRISFVGRYEGNPAHVVSAQFWNYDTTAWDNAVAGGKDFPSAATDSSLSFDYPADSSDYISGGESIFRIDHSSVAVITHNFYTDYIAILTKSLAMPTAGTFYKLTGLADGLQERTFVDGASGEITVQTIAKYTFLCTMSLFGTPDELVMAHIFVNGVIRPDIGARVTIVGTGVVAMVLSCCKELYNGDVVDIRFESTSDDVFIGFEHFNLMIRATN